MFNEANTVEQFIVDLLCGRPVTGQPPAVKEVRELYGRDSIALGTLGLGWSYIPGSQLPRAPTDVLLEEYLRAALIRLNPEIATQPERAGEVLYKLRAILLAVSSDGLVRANEAFAEWLRGEKSMPFGPNHQHVPVRLIDFDTLDNNEFVVANQVIYKTGSGDRRFESPVSARSKKPSARPCSSTNCTKSRSCSTRRMAISRRFSNASSRTYPHRF